MVNIWFSSDFHFGHTNIAGPSVSKWTSGYRDFGSVDEMNECIADNTNSLVKENDIIYNLGDWSFGGYDNVYKFRRRLNCRNIHLCLGNHDHHIKKCRNLQELFTWVKPIHSGKILDRFFVLHHYAQRVWEHSHSKPHSIHCYGHSHSTLPDDPNSLSMDVGFDTCLFGHKKYTPYHYDEIIHIMDNYKTFKPIDHHNEKTT